MNLNIALDFDHTFTEDPELWIFFVQKAKQHGHKVTFVTFRYESGDNSDIISWANKIGIPIVFTNYQQKKSIFNADIWIDDMPELIPIK